MDSPQTCPTPSTSCLSQVSICLALWPGRWAGTMNKARKQVHGGGELVTLGPQTQSPERYELHVREGSSGSLGGAGSWVWADEQLPPPGSLVSSPHLLAAWGVQALQQEGQASSQWAELFLQWASAALGRGLDLEIGRAHV